jgi:DNA-binding response OmpR family regulator
LIENSNSFVSFDAIADNFSDSDENFSLYAISKTIQRLRNKLETNGISGSYIQTLRGQGYLLKN